MKYILNENIVLRGWNNIPYAVWSDRSPAAPVRISKELCDMLSAPFEYSGGDSNTDMMIKSGYVVPCNDDSVLTERQKYYNYGCNHFDAVIFSITGRCNYRCMHCSVYAPTAPMHDIPLDKIHDLLVQMKECGLYNIVLIGGEPLIRSDFLKIVDMILELGMFTVQVFTNGSLITEKLLDELEQRKLRPLFMVSFDGVGWHDKMRGVKGAEKTFFDKIDLLHERGFDIACNMCVTKDSIFSLWDTIVTLKEHGVLSLTVYPPASCGLWKDRIDRLGVTYATVIDEYEKVFEKMTENNFPITLVMYGLAYFDSRQKKFALVPNWRSSEENENIIPACKGFKSDLNISPEGLLSPCYAMMSEKYIRENMPDLNKMSLKDALNDPRYLSMVGLTPADVIKHNPECVECIFARLCGGGCRMNAFEQTGDFMGIDRNTCSFFRSGGMERFRAAAMRGRQKRLGR